MGYGKNLEKAINDKGWSVAELARQAKVNVNTLHAIIRRDSAVRYDHALRISNVLGIDITLICKNNPYEEGPTEPGLLNEYGGLLTKINKNSYLKRRLGNVMDLYKYDEFPIIDQLLTSFYQMSDDGRKRFLDYANFVLSSDKDPDREKNIKKITETK
jgi:transcriptional regulator with XRE-family HTH domain